MYIEYSKIGDNVFVTDDKGITKRFDNTNNVEAIIALENEKSASDLRIDKEKEEQKKFKRYRNFISFLGGISLANNIVLAATGHNVSPVLGGALLVTYGVTVGVTHGIVKKFDNKIKEINIYKKALDKELKYELSRKKIVNTEVNEKGTIDYKKSQLYLTYDKFDLMNNVIQTDYQMYGKVTCGAFTDREKRIYNTMLEEEMKSHSKKVKVKEI